MQASQATGAGPFGAWRYPRLVGALVLAGFTSDDATALVLRRVEHQLRRRERDPVRQGARLQAAALEAAAAAPEPQRDPARRAELSGPAGAVAAALADQAWPERLATVAALALDDTTLGPGRPADLAERLAVALDDVEAVVQEALAAVTAPADPGLVGRLLRRRRTRVWAIGLGVVLVAALAALVVTRRGSGSAGADPPLDPSVRTQWVAVLQFAPDAFALYPAVEDLGRSVGVYAFTDEWACYAGLPTRAVSDADDWFLGIAAADEAQLGELVARSGRVPLVTAQVRPTCVLPPPGEPVPTFPSSTP